MSIRIRAGLLAATCVWFQGCASTSLGPSRSWALPAARQPHGVKHIGGVIKASVYTIPSDEVQIVDDSVTIVADTRIDIQGALEIAHSGATFALISPTVRIDGLIRAQSSLLRANTPNGTDLIDACQLDVNGANVTIASGDDLDIVSDRKLRSCALTLKAHIFLLPGRTGNPAVRALRDGERGGSVGIGTSTAIAFAQRTLHRAGVDEEAYPPANIVPHRYAFFAGNGGAGAVDNSGTLVKETSTWIFQGGSGGKGGSVLVSAGTVEKSGAAVFAFAGNGGEGGAVSDTFLAGAGVNGTARHPNAYSVSFFEGSGGDGGYAAITAKGAAKVQAGDGADAGPVASVAGAGYFNPAGSGGDITVHLGKRGIKGIDGGSGAKDGSYPYMYFTGGYGGTALSTATASNGGNGATLFVEGPPDGKGVPGDFKMRIANFGSGGSGMSPCGSPGAKGGNGGNLLYNDGVERRNFEVLSGFNGGTGGAGTPPGAGGMGGRDNDGKPIGMNGLSGATC